MSSTTSEWWIKSQGLYRRKSQFLGSLDHRALRVLGQSQVQDEMSHAKKRMAADTHFKNRKFSGHEDQSFDETLADFEMCTRMLR